MTKNDEKMKILKKSFEIFFCSESIQNKLKSIFGQNIGFKFFSKNGQKWSKMTKNGQKWSKMNIFEKKNRHDRILSRRDLVDSLKNPEKYCATGVKFCFSFFDPKNSKMVKKVKK